MQWFLNCHQCRKYFKHSDIEPRPTNHLSDYDPLWPYRPDVPEEGFQMACPNCGETATYHRYQLTLSRSRGLVT
jgi:hypothetical protein